MCICACTFVRLFVRASVCICLYCGLDGLCPGNRSIITDVLGPVLLYWFANLNLSPSFCLQTFTFLALLQVQYFSYNVFVVLQICIMYVVHALCLYVLLLFFVFFLVTILHLRSVYVCVCVPA